jgi:hypothetical protein
MRTLTIIAILCGAVLALPNAPSAEEQMKPNLRTQIEALMNERKQLWLKLGPEGSRAIDVSEIVCAMVDPDSLNEIALQDPEFPRAVVPSGGTGFPDGTMSWIFVRPVDILIRESLIIWIQPDGSCIARYRHVM